MKKLFYIILTVASFTACSLDKYPYDSVETEKFFENEKSLFTATEGSYAVLAGDENGNGFTLQMHRVGEYAGDNVSLSGTTTDGLFYTYSYANITSSNRIDNLWDTGYIGIVGCNKVIELAEEGTSEELDQLIGENYYLRAYAHFQLVNVFGRPYIQGTSNLGVPLKLTSDVEDVPDRSTVGEVYTQVISDLKKAASLMSIDKINSYATKQAAQALLSRVYLYMGENDLAIKYADSVINSGKFSLVSNDKLKDYFKTSPDNNQETIFCFKFLEEGNYNHGWHTIGSLYANIEGVGWGEMYASRPFLDLINQHPEDARRAFIDTQYTLDEKTGNKIPVVYWINNSYTYQFRETFKKDGKTYFTQDKVTYEVVSEGEDKLYFKDNSGNKIYVTEGYDIDKRNGFPKYYVLKASLQEGVPQLWSPVVSRLAEMYLNKAEAYAKMNNEVKALENVNTIRKRAGIPKYESAVDFPEGKDLLDIVLDERRLELAYEGHRKFDVFRNNKVMDRKYPGSHPATEIQPTDARVIEFIPQDEINAQPSLIQND